MISNSNLTTVIFFKWVETTNYMCSSGLRQDCAKGKSTLLSRQRIGKMVGQLILRVYQMLSVDQVSYIKKVGQGGLQFDLLIPWLEVT